MDSIALFVGSTIALSLLRKSKTKYNVTSQHVLCETSNNIGVPHPFTNIAEYKNCIYLDYNATTPIFPEVSAAMQPFILTSFGNPSSSHVFGLPCKSAVVKARHQVAELINARNDESIIFMSCGTECDNRSIDIAIHNFNPSDQNLLPHIIACNIEHPAILVYLELLRKRGKIELTILSVDNNGLVNPDDVAQALQSNTVLVTIMHSNNEIGTIQPIRDIGIKIFQYNSLHRNSSSSIPVLFHSDAAQSIGKITIDVSDLLVDMLTVVGHKFGAPKGISALYLGDFARSGKYDVPPFLVGGGQERGIRSGTECVPLIVGLGEACRIARMESYDMMVHLLSLRIRLLHSLERMKCLLSDISKGNHENSCLRYNGPQEAYDILYASQLLKQWKDNKAIYPNFPVLLNTVSVSIYGIKTKNIMPLILDKVACSAGSACHSSEGDKLSPVLAAIEVPLVYGLGTLRLSFGRHTTATDIDRSVEIIYNSIIKCKMDKPIPVSK